MCRLYAEGLALTTRLLLRYNQLCVQTARSGEGVKSHVDSYRKLLRSLPRPAKLQAAIKDYDAGKITRQQLEAEQDAACLDSIKRMEATGAPIVSDGEQRASSFATYPLTDTLAGTGLAENLAGDGQYFAIFTDGHHRQLPRLTGGPFRYKTFAADYLVKAMKMATKPLKQAVIAPSMLALLYPLDGEVKGYTARAIPQRFVR